jgi:hypothetical protein
LNIVVFGSIVLVTSNGYLIIAHLDISNIRDMCLSETRALVAL